MNKNSSFIYFFQMKKQAGGGSRSVTPLLFDDFIALMIKKCRWLHNYIHYVVHLQCFPTHCFLVLNAMNNRDDHTKTIQIFIKRIYSEHIEWGPSVTALTNPVLLVA